ncbi:MAG: hypothetical protein ACKV2T_32290 [Kofleriaceae bacterium]
MRAALTFLALFAACTSKTTGGGGEGDSCDVMTACGDTAVCSVTHTTDGSGECIAKGEDLDSDGLANEMDYCNASAGGQYDEDRDLIGDECDKCPIASPLANPDPDGDEVESPCDPDPREPGDRIVAFEGFRNGIPSTWAKTGTWEQRGGDAVATSTTEITLTTALPLTTTKMALLVQYRVDAVDAGQPTPYIGLVARDQRPASNAVVRCGSQRSAGIGDALSLEGDRGAMVAPVVNAFNSASLYSIALRLQGLSAQCAMIADETQVAAEATTSGEALTQAGIFVKGGTARFSYVLAIQRP